MCWLQTGTLCGLNWILRLKILEIQDGGRVQTGSCSTEKVSKAQKLSCNASVVSQTNVINKSYTLNIQKSLAKNLRQLKEPLWYIQ